jgi:glycosyltransferase involved in cell wall biosynthesis
LNKKAHDKLAYIIVASKYIKNLLVKSGYRENHVKILPYYTILPEQDDTVDLPNEPTIVCVSRIEAEKGVDYLLRALSRVDIKSKVFIIGEGTQISKLRQLARSLKDKHEIIFAGWIDNGELTKFYSQATMAVVPSIWPEPFGIIGIEAMANKAPVIAFDVGGISQWLIDGKTGYLVPRKDEKALAQKIEFYLKNPKIAKTMGIEGRRLVEKKFVPEIHINNLVELFKKAAL